MEFKITEETVNKVLQYLASKPFIEVNQIIDELRQVQPIGEKAPKEETPKEAAPKKKD